MNESKFTCQPVNFTQTQTCSNFNPSIAPNIVKHWINLLFCCKNYWLQGKKGERVASGPILFAASLNISQLCIDGIAQQQVRMWNIPVPISKLTFSDLITNSVCVKEIRNINYAIPFLYLNYGQRMPDLCNLHAYLMFQVRPRSEGEFLGQIEENLTHPPEPSKTKMC